MQVVLKNLSIISLQRRPLVDLVRSLGVLRLGILRLGILRLAILRSVLPVKDVIEHPGVKHMRLTELYQTPNAG